MEPPSTPDPAPGGHAAAHRDDAASPDPRAAAADRVAPLSAPGLGGPDALEPDVFVIDRRWHRLVPHAERWARRAALAAGGAGAVVLDNDLRVRRLNARHRGRNKATNVLTFETPPGIPGGDIVLALETIRREALGKGCRAAHHLAHLVVHGALHLRGEDHHLAGQARRMEMREARILHRLGVPNPWKPRA